MPNQVKKDTTEINPPSPVISMLLYVCISLLLIALAMTHISVGNSAGFYLSFLFFPVLLGMPAILLVTIVVSIIGIVRAIRQLIRKDKVTRLPFLLSIAALLLGAATFIPSVVDHSSGLGMKAVVQVASLLPGSLGDTTKYSSYAEVKEKIDSCSIEYVTYGVFPGKTQNIRSNGNIDLKLLTSEEVNSTNFEDFHLHLPYSDRMKVYNDMKASGCYEDHPNIYSGMLDELPESL